MVFLFHPPTSQFFLLATAIGPENSIHSLIEEYLFIIKIEKKREHNKWFEIKASELIEIKILNFL